MIKRMALSVAVLMSAGFASRDTEPLYGAWVHDYHHLSIDCDFITHAFGRNAAWGLWRMPVSEVGWVVSESETEGQLTILFTCRDGSDCIQQGELDTTPGRVDRHVVPVKALDRIEGFDATMTAIDTACAVAGVEAMTLSAQVYQAIDREIERTADKVQALKAAQAGINPEPMTEAEMG